MSLLRQANGPRDFSIMIRGSGVEDNLCRSRHQNLRRWNSADTIGRTLSSRYAGSLVYAQRRSEPGASSSLYDNYALGGMVHFRTRRGRDINGVEAFLSGGSYGYQKYGVAIGQEYTVDISMFGSHVARRWVHPAQQLQYANHELQCPLSRSTTEQNFYFKAIKNWLNTKVPTRLSQSQFFTDERQAGGQRSTTVSNDALRLGQGRIDRRTIVGGLYERQSMRIRC